MTTLKASPYGLVRIKQVRKEKGWAIDDFRWIATASQILGINWDETGSLASGISEGTWKRFLAGKQAIKAEAFQVYCQVLGLNWEEVVEREGYCDWGEAPDVSHFYDRASELETLQSWILDQRCRLVCILGMGGIGKTALAIKLGQQIQPQFKFTIWLSLRHSPNLEDLLVKIIQFLAKQKLQIPENITDRIALLLKYLRSDRCLLILDNLESILEGGDRAGGYLASRADYAHLFESIGQTDHQSCLILTSREKPQGFAVLEGDYLPVRCYQLSGLSTVAAREICNLQAKFVGDDNHWRSLVDRYGGNPLALKIVSVAIQDFFGSNLANFIGFIQQETFLFDDIKHLLSKQFERLNSVQQDLMYWLALNLDPVGFAELIDDSIVKISPGDLMQEILSLQRRSLIEKRGDYFSQQPVIMEYAIAKLIEEIVVEVSSSNPQLLRSHILVKTQAQEYIARLQISLIAQPIIARLINKFGSPANLAIRLWQIIDAERSKIVSETSYLTGNLINFLRIIEGDFTQKNLSDLIIWQADFRGIKLHEVNLTNSDVAKSAFTETSGNILSAAFSPDGQFLVTGDIDGKIRLWDVDTGKLVSICHAHDNWIRAIAYSPDGKVATGSVDGSVKIWDLNAGECLKIIRHSDEVFSVTFSPNGLILASGSADRTVKLWDVDGGNCLTTLAGHTHSVRSLSFAPDGKILASGSADRTVKLWDLNTANCLYTWQEHTDWVQSVAFSPDGQILASGSLDRTIKLWNIKAGKCDRTYNEHGNSVYCVAFSPDGRFLASGSGDKTVKLWNLVEGQCDKTLYGHTNQVTSLAFNPVGRAIVCVSLDQTVRLWDWQTGNCLKSWQGHSDWAFPVAFSPDGLTLVSGGGDKTINLWDSQTGNLTGSWSANQDRIWSVAFSHDSRIIASGGSDRTIKLWDMQTQKQLHQLQEHTDWVTSVAFSPINELLASGSADRTIKLWQTDTGDCIATLAGHSDRVWSVAFNATGDRLVSSSSDRAIVVWNVITGECVSIWSIPESKAVYCANFSPDGKTIASGHGDCTVKLWDVQSGRCWQTLTGHAGFAFAVVFCKESDILASASSDRTIKLWNLKTGECLHTLTGHSNQVCSLAFNPARQILASGSQDQTIRFWSIQTGRCIKILKSKRIYEGMNINGIKGLTSAQISSLKSLGAIDN